MFNTYIFACPELRPKLMYSFVTSWTHTKNGVWQHAIQISHNCFIDMKKVRVAFGLCIFGSLSLWVLFLFLFFTPKNVQLMHLDASDHFSGVSCALHLSPKNVKEIILHFCQRKNLYQSTITSIPWWRVEGSL